MASFFFIQQVFFFSDKDSPWYSLWPLILEHMRLLFQCGESLESIALAFSSTLGVEENNVSNMKLASN